MESSFSNKAVVERSNSNGVTKFPARGAAIKRAALAQKRGNTQDAWSQTGVQSSHMESVNVHAFAGDQGKRRVANIALRVDGKRRPDKAAPRLKKNGRKRARQVGRLSESRIASLF